METSKKLLEAFDEFRPHINGHGTAIELFLEAVKEVELLQKELSLHNVSQQRELMSFEKWAEKHTTRNLKEAIKLALNNYKKAKNRGYNNAFKLNK